MDESNKYLAHLGGSLSKLLAHAVLDLFPGTQLFCDWVKESEFAYQFILKNKIDLLDLSIIEDRMVFLQNSSLDFYSMEMIPSNAQELFKAQNQYVLQKELKKSAFSTVQVIKINHFYDLDRFGFISSDIKKTFKLLSYEIQEKDKSTLLTIKGMTADDKNQLKKKLKHIKKLRKYSHEIYGQKLSLFNEGLFLPKGLKLLDDLRSEINTHFNKSGFQETKLVDFQSDFKKILIENDLFNSGSKYFLWNSFKRNSKNPLEYGLFKIKNHTHDQWISITNSDSIENECISCLNFYKQIIKILGFSYRVEVQVGSCPKFGGILSNALEQAELKANHYQGDSFEIRFEALDCYERIVLKPTFKVSSMSLQGGKKGYAIEGEFCRSLEMLLAQMIEHYEGSFPLKGSQEQLKTLTINQGQKYGQELYDYFKINQIEVAIDSSEQR